MDKKKCDIIIVTYNRRALLIELLERLRYQTDTNFNMLINDDGSKESDLIKPAQYPIITIYKTNVDDGYHRVRRFNECIEMAVSPNIILLDDDLSPVSKNWFSMHMKNLEQFDISRGVVRFHDNKSVAHGARTSWFTSCNCGFKADKLKNIQYKNNKGGFDISYNGHYGVEDVDLGETVKKLGYTRSPFLSDTECLHKGKYFADGDRSDKIVKHNRDYFQNKWGYPFTAINGLK